MITKINNIPVLKQATYSLDYKDVYEEAKNSLGDTFLDIKGCKATIEVKWDGLEQAEMTKLQGLLRNTVVSLAFWDSVTGTEKTADFICGNRKAGLLIYIDNKKVWKDMQITFMEV